MMTHIENSNAPTDLAATLVLVARERGIGVEHLYAAQLLAESRDAWPGDAESMWSKWLAEASKSIGLHARMTRLSVKDALALVEDGVQLVCKPSGGGTAVILGTDGRHVEIASPGREEHKRISIEELANLVGADSNPEMEESDSRRAWLVVEDPKLGDGPGDNFHDRPVARLVALLQPEKSDIWVVTVFAFFAGVLSLATPIAVESLVNIVAFGRMLQPLLILSLILFAFLVFASMMRALQTFVVEIIQRRLFVRVAADLAFRFPRVQGDATDGQYGPELANRFFDIVTLQKVVAQLLLDGIAIILATAVGMAVLAFYHPWLLGYNVLLLVLVIGGVVVLGRGAIASGIDESRQKYRLAAWLEDLLRCQVGFKASGAPEFALDRANQMTADYLESRRRHFRVLFRQLLFILGLQAIAGTVLLGFGGWLVIRGQLTLGQLVAAELIVATILGSMAKLGKHIDGFYDVVASVDKLGHLFDLRMEPRDGLLSMRPGCGVRLRITDVHHPNGSPSLKRGFTLQVDSNERASMLSDGFAGSTVLFDMLYGLQVPASGHIEIEHADPRDIRPDVLRKTVALVRGVEVFDGTVAENVQLARPGVSMTDVRGALDAVGLLDTVLRLPDGLETRLNAGSNRLISSQLHLLMLARAIAGQPRLLLIDGSLDGLGDSQLSRVCQHLCDDAREWTVLVATNRGDIASSFPRIIETELGAQTNSMKLLPSLPNSGIVP